MDLVKDDVKVSKNIEEENNKNEIDYMEATIGSIGIWQVCVCVAASSARYLSMGNLMFIIFLTPATEFICTEFKNNTTIAAQKMTCYESCIKYQYNSSAMDRTIISDFDLICDRQWLASFVQTVLMFGVVIGVSLFGWISDRFGRRIALNISIILNLVSMVPSAFSPNYWVYTSLRLITGIATGGSLIICIPIVMEVSSKKYRAMAVAFAVLPDCIGETSLALLAYYLPTWETFTLGFSILCVLILVFVLFVPESPRWLLSKGKIDEAIYVITRAAKWNKLSTEHISTVLRNVVSLDLKTNEDTTYLDLFTKKSLRKNTLITIIIWTLIGSMFFGLYQYMTLLASNVYLTVIVIGLIQVPLCVIQILITKYFSRRSTMIGLLTTSGIALIMLIFIPNDHWSSILFKIIGFSACCMSFGVVYVYHGELYPTSLRSMALGLASAANKFGAMVSPFIARISPVWIPSLMFAILAFAAAVLCFLLPETKGKNLKDVVE